MARVFFTTNLRRHVDLAEADAQGATVREVLADVFAREARIGGYVLDDQGGAQQAHGDLRRWPDPQDRVQLSDPVPPSSEIYVFQALSPARMSTMSDRMLVSTRKGLFTVDRGAPRWAVAERVFLGDNVTLALRRSAHRRAATRRSTTATSA